MSTSSKQPTLYEAIDRLPGATVGIIGDLVADCYISGLTDRVSREAPVLILRYEQEWIVPGGAANVAANVAALGARACLVGAVGEDAVGSRLLADLKDEHDGRIDGEAIVTASGRSTISKTRFLAGAKLTHRQQVLRLDREPTGPADGQLAAQLLERLVAVDPRVDAWVVSDYGYQSFDSKLLERLREIARHKPVVVDSRWDLHRFSGMTLLKPNEEEAYAVARQMGFCATDEAALASQLATILESNGVLMTLGNKGMMLSSGGENLHIPAVGTEEIVDLTGAGDSVAATLTTALAAGGDVETAARLANHAGGIVVMKEGAATASPDELRQSIERYGA